ncbi:Nn.00g077670.m01.CDS01 [Neocucurbitaria sp. VM-36]
MGPHSDVDRVLGYINENLRFRVYEDPSIPNARYCIPKTGLKEYMTRDRLTKLLDSCYVSTNWETVRNNYLAVFVNLLYINKGTYITHFTSNPRLIDTHLPFEKNGRWPVGCDFFESFDEKQLEFCAEELKSDRLEETIFPTNAIIPIISRTTLKGGHGVDSSTYRIMIHQDYDLLPKDAKDLSPTRYFVLKSCPVDRNESHRNEVRGYTVLRRYEEISNNIACFYGSWTQGNVSNILLEYIDGGTLTALFRTDPPTRAEDMLRFWDHLLRILDPICKIHSHKDPSDHTSIAIGVHQDIKPDNILKSQNFSGLKYDFDFKLGDLGLAYFEPEAKGKRVRGREQPGTQMYSAPECFRDERDSVDYQSTRPVDTLKDIWSLGCVLSEAVVWSVLGPSTWKEYHELRVAETDKVTKLQRTAYSGCFHNGKTLLPVVRDMHDRVREGRRNPDQIVNDVLPIIQDMLRDVDSRPNAATIRNRFRDAVDTAKRMSGVPISEAKYPRPFRNSSGPNHEQPQLARTSESPLSLQESSLHDSVSHMYEVRGAFTTGPSASRPPPVLPPILHDRADPTRGLPPRAMTLPYKSATSPMQPKPFGNASDPAQGLLKKGNTFGPDSVPDSTMRGGSGGLPLGQGLSTINSVISSDQEPRPPAQQEVGTNGQFSRYPSTPFATVAQVLDWIRGKKGNKSKTPIQLPGGVSKSDLNDLHDRDQIFLIDNSASMEQYREDVIKTFAALAYLVKGFDPDGIDLCFTNHHEESNSQNREKLLQLLKRVEFNGQCSMDVTLTKILDQRSENRLSNRLRRVVGKKKWGISIYVLTNGIWNNPGDSGVGGMPKLIKRTVEKMHGRAKLGIQFIQFGNDPIGIERLEKLDDSLVSEYGVYEDIIDTTRYDDNVYKMLHGAIDENWDQRPSTGKVSSSSHHGVGVLRPNGKAISQGG